MYSMKFWVLNSWTFFLNPIMFKQKKRISGIYNVVNHLYLHSFLINIMNNLFFSSESPIIWCIYGCLPLARKILNRPWSVDLAGCLRCPLHSKTCQMKVRNRKKIFSVEETDRKQIYLPFFGETLIDYFILQDLLKFGGVACKRYG